MPNEERTVQMTEMVVLVLLVTKIELVQMVVVPQ
jgi:hypothetical protein